MVAGKRTYWRGAQCDVSHAGLLLLHVLGLSKRFPELSLSDRGNRAHYRNARESLADVSMNVRSLAPRLCANLQGMQTGKVMLRASRTAISAAPRVIDALHLNLAVAAVESARACLDAEEVAMGDCLSQGANAREALWLTKPVDPSQASLPPCGCNLTF